MFDISIDYIESDYNFFQRTLGANLGYPIEYLRMSHSEATEVTRQGLVREYVKADLSYQTLNVKTVEEEPVYTVMSLNK